MTILHKAGIVKADAKLAERNNDLRNRFYVGRSPRGESSLIILHFGEVGQSFVRRALDRFLVLIFCQCLQCHSANIYVRVTGAGQAPAAVFLLAVQNFIDVKLPRGLRFCGGILRNTVIARV